jgi:hypothetical protein
MMRNIFGIAKPLIKSEMGEMSVFGRGKEEEGRE